MKKWMGLAAVLAVGLGGCAMPLDKDNTRNLTVSSTLSSATAYQRILQASRKCYLLENPWVTADYFPESHEGTIQYSMGNRSALYQQAIELAKIDIKPSSDGSVINIALRRQYTKFEPAINAWLRGETVDCPYS